MPMRLRSRALYHAPAGRNWRTTARGVLITALALAVLVTAGLIAVG